MKYLSILSFILLSVYGVNAQSNWSVSTNLGIASEQNLGDLGLRLSTKTSRHFGQWSAFAQVGTFQMFQSNEDWTGNDAYRNKRSLSTTNLDLGAGFALLHTTKVSLGVEAGGSYRIGRQLWPERSEIINGQQQDYYTLEKLKEVGYMLGLNFNVRANSRLWIGVDAHCHSYNLFGEYLGAGLGATIFL